ncbi:DUF805 domain-containing protein [Sandarakinorhabdus sp.]|uniref:DUF805 domain-containing protein n=1 Tax=Sandarakinorhabdus sp. TaxID=1916663 RepID=UPI00286DE3C4|nr:DUF805 domain-containing protein [Sandarakinorhabdus sp.]
MITRSATEWMLLPLKRYAQFSGRSPRAEYWWFALFSFLISLPAAILDVALGLQLFNPIVSLGLLLPSIAVGVRRLHDLDRTGWWLLAPLALLVPTLAIAGMAGAGGAIAGLLGSEAGAGAGVGSAAVVVAIGGVAVLAMAVVMLAWYCTRGTQGENRFGPDPLAEAPNPTVYYG